MRELKFRYKKHKYCWWRSVIAMQVALSVQGSSTNYTRIWSNKDRTKQITSNVFMQQFVDGEWRNVDFRSLKFKTKNPKDDSITDVSSLPCLPNMDMSVTFHSFCEIECVDKSKPNAFISCDGWKPLRTLPIWQIIDDQLTLIYSPEGRYG